MLSQTSAPGGPGGGYGPSSWLRTFVPRPNAAVRLVCFPHAGGSVGSFRRLAGLVPGNVELTAVQYPGRQDRYAVPLTGVMTELAGQIHRELAPGFDRPTAFLGHSMGATVAFETARLLRPRSVPPLVALFASARKAPHECRPTGLDFHDPERVRSFVRELGGSGAEHLDHEDLWDLALPMLRNDFMLVDAYRYRPGPPLGCPIVTISGAADLRFTREDAQHWSPYTTGAFEAHTLPGGHFYIEEHPELLAELLADALRRLAPPVGHRVTPADTAAPTRSSARAYGGAPRQQQDGRPPKFVRHEPT